MKPFILIQGPVATRSGYGNHTRDLSTALISTNISLSANLLSEAFAKPTPIYEQIDSAKILLLLQAIIFI